MSKPASGSQAERRLAGASAAAGADRAPPLPCDVGSRAGRSVAALYQAEVSAVQIRSRLRRHTRTLPVSVSRSDKL